MSQPHEVDPYIRVYDGVFPDELCERIVSAFEDDHCGQSPGRTAGGYDPNASVRTVIMLGARMDTPDGNERWAAIDAEICSHLGRSWAQYLHDVPTGHYLAGANKIEDSGYHIQKYEAGKGFFGRHVDGSVFSLAFRVAAAIVYLNTVEVGGGTRFPLHDLTINCVRGRVLWFPATWTYEHEGTMPVSDHKWAISTFLCHRGHKLLGEGGPAYNAIMDAIGSYDD